MYTYKVFKPPPLFYSGLLAVIYLLGACNKRNTPDLQFRPYYYTAVPMSGTKVYCYENEDSVVERYDVVSKLPGYYWDTILTIISYDDSLQKESYQKYIITRDSLLTDTVIQYISFPGLKERVVRNLIWSGPGICWKKGPVEEARQINFARMLYLNGTEVALSSQGYLKIHAPSDKASPERMSYFTRTELVSGKYVLSDSVVFALLRLESLYAKDTGLVSETSVMQTGTSQTRKILKLKKIISKESFDSLLSAYFHKY